MCTHKIQYEPGNWIIFSELFVEGAMAETSVFKMMLDAYDYPRYNHPGTKFVPPVFEKSRILQLCTTAKSIMAKEPTLLSINRNINVIGDLCGHINYLFRFICDFGLPPISRYLFLGNIIGKGPHSLETLCFVFLMKIIWPNDVFILRGNNEFDKQCQSLGFQAEIMRKNHDSEVFRTIMDTLAYTPLAATIGAKSLCVHGGIGPKLQRLVQILDIKRPIYDIASVENVKPIVGSEPSEATSFYQVSPNGQGFLFGKPVIKQFLENSNLSLLIRASSSILEGVYTCFDNLVYSVRSYSNANTIKVGILHVSSLGIPSPSISPAIPGTGGILPSASVIVKGNRLQSKFSMRNIPTISKFSNAHGEIKPEVKVSALPPLKSKTILASASHRHLPSNFTYVSPN